MPPQLSFHPPLLNSASPWATTASDLRALLLSPSTGAITVRTSLLAGFDHDPEKHRYLFFDGVTGEHVQPGVTASSSSEASTTIATPNLETSPAPASLNTLGYSPIPLHEYLSIIASLIPSLPPTLSKTIIISVTGSPDDIAQCYHLIVSSTTAPSSTSTFIPFPLAMEINLSCPNIPGSPPPAYSASSLAAYLAALAPEPSIPIGIKIPPYTHAGEFDALVSALLGTLPPPTSSSSPLHSSTSPPGPIPASKLSFLTATNTLGSCLVLSSPLPSTESSSSPQESHALPGGIGGMAGPPLHPLALGNVSTLRRLFDADPHLAHLEIIGVGGVHDGEGYKRMRRVGAKAVALATALGTQGVGVFEKIEKDIGSSW